MIVCLQKITFLFGWPPAVGGHPSFVKIAGAVIQAKFVIHFRNCNTGTGACNTNSARPFLSGIAAIFADLSFLYYICSVISKLGTYGE